MSKKILLADDSVTIQKVISITFSSEDYELTVVGDGDSAINKAKEERPDLILADVAMPGKNGYEVSEALKKDPATANIPVMLLAGTFEPLDKHEAERVKADESIVKPFESQELLDKVRTLLAKGATAPSGGASAKAGAEEIWEPGDFTGFTEEPEFKEQEAPDLSFLEEGLSETADLSGPEGDFTDLEFREEDLKGLKESAAPPPPPPPPAPAPEPKPEPKPEPEPEKKPAAYEPPVSEEFDIVEPFEVKVEEAKDDTFDIPSFKEEPAAEAPEVAKAKKPFWAETERDEEALKISEAVAETDLLEAPQEAGEVVEFVDVVEEKAPLKEAAGAARTEPAPLSGAQAEQAAAGSVAKLEERFRGELDSRLKGAEAEIAKTIEKTVARVEDSITKDIGAKIEKSISIPKEEVAEIVRKTAKEVIEEVAWEVIPELAEELIKAEIGRVKEAMIKGK